MKFNDVTGRVAALSRNKALRSMTWVFLLKAAITVLNFALITLAARSLGKSSFGTYSVLFSAAGLFGVVATFGQQIVSMRSWSEYSSAGQQHLLKGAMIFSAIISITGSVLVAIPFYAWAAATHGFELAGSVTFYLVALSILLTTSHLVRTAIGVSIGDGVGNRAADKRDVELTSERLGLLAVAVHDGDDGEPGLFVCGQVRVVRDAARPHQHNRPRHSGPWGLRLTHCVHYIHPASPCNRTLPHSPPYQVSLYPTNVFHP